nr:hypothetical protein [Tanacetum cinerariifolium]
MDTTINQQMEMDEGLVPHAKRLRIRRSKSKESTLQLEFWATATVHHHSIRFKMDNKKHIVNLESFREMLHIFPRLPHQPFIEPPFEEEILAFLWFLGHNGVTRKLTDGLYHKRNVDFAYLMWEDFVYQEDHEELEEVCWRKAVRGRLQDASKDHMIYHMLFLSFKRVVRHRYSNPMIQPEPKGSTQGYPLVSVEVLRYDKRSKSEYMEIVPTEMELILEHTQQGISHEVSVSTEVVEELKRNVKINGVKKEALLTH